MIRSFADKDTSRLYEQQHARRFHSIERVALRRLLLLSQARSLHDLKGPGFGLEALKGRRKRQYSIRISDQWRICCVWHAGDAFDVEVTEYH